MNASVLDLDGLFERISIEDYPRFSTTTRHEGRKRRSLEAGEAAF